MKHTEWYYHIVQKYRAGLNRINEKYDKKIEAKSSYAGSAGYAADAAKIEQERAAEIGLLRDECRNDFDRCISEMERNANARPAVAPTAEQLSLVQLLKLKTTVSRDELERAANTLSGCGIALSILEEIARDNGILGFHASAGDVSDQSIKDSIRQFTQSARTTLSMERTNRRRELMNPTDGKGDGPFGTLPRMEDISKFRLDVDPESAKECAGKWGGVPADVYDAFCAAVDGGD